MATSKGACPSASGVIRSISEAIAFGDEQSMRILPSQSRVMNPNRGSTSGFTTVRSSPWRSAISPQYATDAPPMGSAPMRTPASRIASTSITCGRSDTYRSRKSKPPSFAWPATSALATRRTPASPPASSSLARSAIHVAASVSAGPPWGGLYLKPPSAGGLCEGVITRPSTRPALSPSTAKPDGDSSRPAFRCRIAWETAGVGV